MRRVRRKATTHQQATSTERRRGIPLEDGLVTMVMIQALIPLGLRVVEAVSMIA